MSSELDLATSRVILGELKPLIESIEALTGKVLKSIPSIEFDRMENLLFWEELGPLIILRASLRSGELLFLYYEKLEVRPKVRKGGILLTILYKRETLSPEYWFAGICRGIPIFVRYFEERGDGGLRVEERMEIIFPSSGDQMRVFFSFLY